MTEKNLMKISTGLGKKIDEKRAYGFRMLFLITIFYTGELCWQLLLFFCLGRFKPEFGVMVKAEAGFLVRVIR